MGKQHTIDIVGSLKSVTVLTPSNNLSGHNGFSDESLIGQTSVRKLRDIVFSRIQ